MATLVLACGVADFPGYTATFTNESVQQVLVRFEDGVLSVQAKWSDAPRGTTDTLYEVPPGARGVGVDWVNMEWGGGLLGPPDPVGHVRVLTLDCETIGLFEVRRGGGEPRIRIDEGGHATVSYAGGHNPEASIRESNVLCAPGPAPGTPRSTAVNRG